MGAIREAANADASPPQPRVLKCRAAAFGRSVVAQKTRLRCHDKAENAPEFLQARTSPQRRRWFYYGRRQASFDQRELVASSPPACCAICRWRPGPASHRWHSGPGLDPGKVPVTPPLPRRRRSGGTTQPPRVVKLQLIAGGRLVASKRSSTCGSYAARESMLEHQQPTAWRELLQVLLLLLQHLQVFAKHLARAGADGGRQFGVPA